MEIHFNKLTPELTDDFFRFFDRDAFSDHEEWAGCYCLESHIKTDVEGKIKDKAVRRGMAEDLIARGVMNGYLIYDSSAVVGWCNVGDKLDFGPICEDPAFFTDNPAEIPIKALYCMDIAPQYRGKGIANLAFEKALADAKAEGYDYFEGYPYTDEKDPYQYKGPVKLYQKYGFEVYRKADWFYVMRKAL